MVKFSQDLWDGFDVLNNKTELGVQVVKDVSDFIKKRAQLEAEYAKGLAALCKTVPGAATGLFSKGPAAVEKDSKTLKAAILSIQEEGSRAATAHQDFANKLLNDIVKPLDNFLKTKENDRKKVATEGQKRIKALVEAKLVAEKAKDTYQRATKEAEQATEAHDKASAELSAASDNKKLQEAEKRAGSKVGLLNEKAKSAEGSYQKAVDAANELIAKSYGEHLPPLIDSLQQFEEERYTQLRDLLKEYHSAQRAIPTNLEERCGDIEKNIGAIDIDADLAEFVEANKSASSEPEKIVFVTKDGTPAITTAVVTEKAVEKEATPPAPTPAPTPAPVPSDPPKETMTEENLF